MVKIRVNILLFSTAAVLLLCGNRVAVYGQQVRVSSRTPSIEKTIGVVSLNPTGYKKNSQLRFFNKDGSLWYQYSFHGDAGVPSSARADFKPFAFHPDYFLLVVKCVKRYMGRSVNPLRTAPSTHGNPIHLADKMLFRPVQIRGNWLKVRAEFPENARPQSGVRTGWVKWRDAKDLLIEPFYFS
jgi:hypothetical protein